MASSSANSACPTVVGHPFMPSGRGEDARCCFRALRGADVECGLRDVYDAVRDKDQDWHDEFFHSLVQNLSPRVNIFLLNGDEIVQSLSHLEPHLPAGSYKILYPAWELSNYPQAWRRDVERFDEIWAPSRFTGEALSAVVSRPVRHMPLPCEPVLTRFLGRQHFGIPDAAFVFLFMFDFTSYLERKNPYAVLDAYREFRGKNPYRNCRMVIKLNGGKERPEAYESFIRRTSGEADLHVVDRVLSDNETKNLVRNSDCFVSMHRSEGFGRGLAEAMFFGKPIIATGYSGNMDFMNETNSCIVPFELIPLTEGQYPFWEGQVWADADVGHVALLMEKLTSESNFGRAIGEVASRHIRQHHSYRACGVRYAARFEEILKSGRRS